MNLELIRADERRLTDEETGEGLSADNWVDEKEECLVFTSIWPHIAKQGSDIMNHFKQAMTELTAFVCEPPQILVALTGLVSLLSSYSFLSFLLQNSLSNLSFSSVCGFFSSWFSVSLLFLLQTLSPPQLHQQMIYSGKKEKGKKVKQ